MNCHKAIILFSICLHTFLFGQVQERGSIKTFCFGNEATAPSGVAITHPIHYADGIGYGFDFNSSEHVVFENQAITSNNSIYFSMELAEGNYKVDVVLGGSQASETTIKAESKRLMLREMEIAADESVHCTFVVNVRAPKINDSLYITIKDRERPELNWDHKLTLEFAGTPAVKSIMVTPLASVTTLFLAGDSTVTDQDLEPWASWGQFITQFFGNTIVVANYASSGASLSSFKSSKRLEKILSSMQPGDYLFIEFGHNDEKITGEGNGAWGLYTNLLKEFVITSREKGGIPILLTPTQRRFFESDGTLKSTHGVFPDAMRKVATDLQVPLIDLTKMTTELYESWGDEVSRKAFVQYPANTFPGQTAALEDNTHFNAFGANEIAKCVLQGIRDLDLPLGSHIKPNIPLYSPKAPNTFDQWTLPISSRFEHIKPDGN